MTTEITKISPGLLGRNVFNAIFDNFFQDMPAHIKQSTQGYPVADIYTNEEGYTVMEFALAGFSRSELNVEVKPAIRSITIAANPESVLNTSARRIARRSFTKTFVNYDDDLDLTNTEANYQNGLLTILIPHRTETKPVKIKIA